MRVKRRTNTSIKTLRSLPWPCKQKLTKPWRVCAMPQAWERPGLKAHGSGPFIVSPCRWFTVFKATSCV
jgi:hypothetical protein